MLLIFLSCQVYFHGVIGFANENIDDCGDTKSKINQKFIAIYWLPNTDGSVTFFEANATSKQLQKDKANLTKDINKAFNGIGNPVNLHEDHIDYALYVTWDSMKNSQNYRPQVRQNSDKVRNQNI